MIHISDYFQTLEIMEKMLSDENGPLALGSVSGSVGEGGVRVWRAGRG